MFTQNYYNMIKLTSGAQCITSSITPTSTYVSNTITLPLTRPNGSVKEVSSISGAFSPNFLGFRYLGSVHTSQSLLNETNAHGIFFGNGTTPPTIDDITLSGNVVSGIGTSANITTEIENNVVRKIAVYTITNNNSADVTISEIGYRETFDGYPYLVERTLLDEPVTIPAGGVGQVTYSITFNIA